MTRALSDAALYRLLTWASPSYPIGSYTFSHGLEAAVEAGLVRDAETALTWIADVIELGGGFSEAVFLIEAHAAAERGSLDRLLAAAELACAFAPGEELLKETVAQGAAFAEVTLAASMRGAGGDPPLPPCGEGAGGWGRDAPYTMQTGSEPSRHGHGGEPEGQAGAPELRDAPHRPAPSPRGGGGDAFAALRVRPEGKSGEKGSPLIAFPLLSALASHAAPLPLPVALGCAAGEAGVPARAAALSHLHAFVANLVSACLRLAPVGQTDGQRVLAALEPVVAAAVERAARTSADSLAVSTPASDICSMRHETQYARLFRS